MQHEDEKKVGYIDELPTDEKYAFLNRVQEELNENVESRKENIRVLMDMVLAEENLKCPTNNAFLLRFLRVRKFDVTRAFKVLQQYYRIQDKFPSLFEHYRPSKLLNILRDKIVVMLPYRDQDGRRIMVVRIGIWDPTKCSLHDIMVLGHMLWDCVSFEEETQINGGVVVVDLTGLSFTHLKHGTATNCRILATLLQVHIHGHSIESLHQHVSPEFLPLEYGGKQAPIDLACNKQTQFLLDRDKEIANMIANFGYNKNALP